MESISFLIEWLQSGLSVIVPFVILLGLLIFVHEMGHFLVAKFYKVKIEVFSLGFGKKILQYKKGDTVYCLSLIPLGGYVKMYGDDLSAEISDEQKSVAFLHKPVGQRIAIVLAGPLMNLFFAFLIFTLIAFSGEPRLSAKLGDIHNSSKAYQVGFRSGDTIMSISDKPIKTWSEAQAIIQKNFNKLLPFQIKRKNTSINVSVTPLLGDNPNILSPDEKIGQIEGLSTKSRSSVVAIKSHQSPAFIAGIRTGDLIKKINAVDIHHWRELRQSFNKASFPITVTLDRIDFEKEEATTFSVVLNRPLSKKNIFAQLGFDDPDLYLQRVIAHSPAQKAGLLTGDRLVSINNKTITSWKDVVSSISSFNKEKKPIHITVQRKGKQFTFNIFPKITRQMNRQGFEENRYTVGIAPFIISSIPSIITVKETNPINALWLGATRTWDVTVMTALSFVRLFQAKISPKNIGGILSIGQIASQSFKTGWIQFLQIMAVISVNLFIINLLPVPVLDGGHLLFFSIEAIRGGPISLKKMLVAQQIGVILLMSLMAFALFNDFSRILNFNW